MEQALLFLFLILFPFGQIIRFGILQPIDLVAGIGAVYALIRGFKKPKFFNNLERFLLVAGFSWLLAAAIFKNINVLYGLLYLARIAAYFYFSIYVWHFANKKKTNKSLLLNSLLAVSVVSALFGWIQFFVFPSIKPFFVWGWDEHLYRLVGTFLDPAFLGIILVLGSTVTFLKKKWFLFIFLAISVAFTYSRASYLAFFAAIGYLGLINNNLRKYLLIILVFIALIIALPVKNNKVLSVTREFSALARIENYQETLKIIKLDPVLGVGFNNLCLAKNQFIAQESYSSHACSGSDSSILFILATTGFAGLIIFIDLTVKIWKRSDIFLRVSLVAVFIHSFFSNTLFYPWVIGWMVILFSISLAEG